MIGQHSPKFKLERTSAKITSHGGLVLVDRIVKELGIFSSIERCLGHLKKRRRGYSVSDKVMDLVRLYVSGGDVISDIKQLRMDEAVRGFTGRDSIMASSTAVEFLSQFTRYDVKQLSRVTGRVASNTLRINNNRIATLDVDATFIEAHKREAQMSYHGEPGYYPMLGFIAETQGLLLSEFRDGNASPSSGALPFLREMVARLPDRVNKIRLRSDSAWFNHEVMDFCEDNGIEFAITGQMNSHMKDLVERIHESQWEVFGDNPDEKIAESIYSFEHGKRAYRIIALREPRRQITMFDGKHIYRVIITNMNWGRHNMIKWHRERATSENWIKELKSGFSLEKLPSGRFLSNAAFLQIISLTYNLVAALKVLSLPHEYRTLTVKSLRYQLFQLPAIWIRHARQWILKLGVGINLLKLIRSILYQPFRICRA